jgi:YD repeat-containing protein
MHNGLDKLRIGERGAAVDDDEECITPIKPSAKALGKRRVIEVEEADRELFFDITIGSPLTPSITGPFDTDDIFYDNRDDPYPVENRLDSDSDEFITGRWQQTTRYVYDAAAERTQQRIRRGRVSTLVDGVH